MTQPNCEPLQYPSADKNHIIAGYLYTLPGAAPRAVIQISHGMCEYIGRYRHLIDFFTAQGFAVAGNDHLGHGASAPPEESRPLCRQKRLPLHPGGLENHERQAASAVPRSAGGAVRPQHGQLFARWYAELWPDTIDALILSGTAGPSPRNRLGLALARVTAAVAGQRYHSALIIRAQTGSYCRRIPDAVSHNAWISRDPAVVAAYDADPGCQFNFTAAAYRDMLTALTHVSSRKWAASLPKDLPVLLVAGTDDPVGDYGSGVREVYARLGDAGMQDLTCQILRGRPPRDAQRDQPRRTVCRRACLAGQPAVRRTRPAAGPARGMTAGRSGPADNKAAPAPRPVKGAGDAGAAFVVADRPPGIRTELTRRFCPDASDRRGTPGTSTGGRGFRTPHGPPCRWRSARPRTRTAR